MANSSGWRFQPSLTATTVALGMVLASTMPSCAVEFWNGSASTNWFTVGNWQFIVPTNATSTRIDTITPNATVIDLSRRLEQWSRPVVGTNRARLVVRLDEPERGGAHYRF